MTLAAAIGPDSPEAYAAHLASTTTMTPETIARHTRRVWGTSDVAGAVNHARRKVGRPARGKVYLAPDVIASIEAESPALTRIKAKKQNDAFLAALAKAGAPCP